MLQGLWEWVQPSAPSALHFSKKWTALELITGKEELSSILVMILMTKTWLLFWKRTRPFFTRWHRQLPLQTRVHISIPVSFCFVFAFMLWCDCGAAPLDNVRTWVIWPGSIFPLAQYLKSFSTIARGVQLTQLMHKLRALDHTFRSENTDQTNTFGGTINFNFPTPNRYGTFLRRWNQKWGVIMKFRQQSNFSQCDICQELKFQWLEIITMEKTFLILSPNNQSLK